MNRRSFLKFGAKAAVVAPIALVVASGVEAAPLPISVDAFPVHAPPPLGMSRLDQLVEWRKRGFISSETFMTEALGDSYASTLSAEDVRYVKHIQKMVTFRDGDYVSPGHKDTLIDLR